MCKCICVQCLCPHGVECIGTVALREKMGLEADKGPGSRVVEGKRAVGGAGLFLLLVSLQDVREGCSL